MPTLLVLAAVLLGTGCRQKAELQDQTQQLQAQISELSGTIKKIEAESVAVGDLGYYNNPQKGQVEELTRRIKTLKEDNIRLAEKRDVQKKRVEQAQSDLDAYRSKYQNN